ncbi:AraC family transcriptional regulator [Paenibacillus sp. NPDC058071]|uniref:helix-turn-helix transcriptional regulator n=1 Tax=Paenibacillus sp. NPDC058071 TaxID=3346326 RepID=UPI0036DDA463
MVAVTAKSMELWENTRLEEDDYPFQLFFNRNDNALPGQTILFLHWHEHHEIIVMEQGSAVFHIDSERCEVRQGDVLFVPAGALHVGYSQVEGPVAYVSLVYNPSLYQDRIGDLHHDSLIAPYLEGSIRLPVQPSWLSASGHSRIIGQIIHEARLKRDAYRLMIKTMLYQLLLLLAREQLSMPASGGRKEPSAANRERFKPLIVEIEQNYANKWTVAEAAGMVGLSPYHFCKTFKKLTGRTFVEYIHLCRMNEAERLLADTDWTVTEIAVAVGCDNPNYFTKLFKLYKGEAPSQFRGK